MIHAWYRIGTTFNNSNKITSQSEFMYRLKDLASQCEFTNADEVVKFLILIHNKHSEVKQELLKCFTKDMTLGQCHEYACNIEGNLQSVELSKYVDTVKLHTSKARRRRDVTPAR